MKLSKAAMNWLQDKVKNLEALHAELPMKKREFEALSALWCKERDNDEVYRVWQECNQSIRRIESEIKYFEMITGVLEGKPLYANEVMYSDVNPYEVIEMKTDKTWVVRSMTATIKEDAKKALQDSFIPGGFVGHFDNDKQEWDITSDENGHTRTIRFHSSKSSRGWFDNGRRFSINTCPIKVYDYNF